MKSRKDFLSEKEYREYLVIYFSSVLIPQVINHEYGNEDHAIEYSIKISEVLVDKLRK